MDIMTVPSPPASISKGFQPLEEASSLREQFQKPKNLPATEVMQPSTPPKPATSNGPDEWTPDEKAHAYIDESKQIAEVGIHLQ